MDFLSQTYIALRGPTGAPQTPLETIARLSDRLSPSTLLGDRRAAVLALKGLSRDCKSEVGECALTGLLEVLENDAEVDAEIGKAVLETLNILCEVGDNTATPAGAGVSAREVGYKHTDIVLATEKTAHKLFTLIGDSNFYIRYSTLQFLSTLIQNRRHVVQGYFLNAPAGPGSVLAVLEDKREILRNEGLVMLQSLVSQSPDIQKLLAFEGAFEKLFNVIRQENGVEGGLIVQDCLNCVDGLLRFNVSNQTFFRETQLAPFLCSLLFFPPNLPPHEPAPQEFSLQFWDNQKLANAQVIIAILGMLVGSKSSNEVETNIFIRCLVEYALASNAPTPLKIQALRLLPANLTFPLSSHTLTPYVPVPETNGEEWDRLEPASALDVLTELILHGEYAGMDATKRRAKESLELRAAAVTVYDNYVRNEEVRISVLQTMMHLEDSDASATSTALLQALTYSPSVPLNEDSVVSTQLAALLFSSLVRSSTKCKQLARAITPSSIISASSGDATGAFFVPADGPPVTGTSTPQTQTTVDDDEPPQTLLQMLTDHLSLSFLSRSRTASTDSERDAREWDRLIVTYLALLAQWLWEDPKAVREFLESGGMGVLVEPINQTSEIDPVVQGLCAFLLGICYEYNRDPGEITRSTIHAILNRLGIDTLVGRMAQVRDDQRFKSIGPDDIILPYNIPSTHGHLSNTTQESGGVEIWFDFSFVDFWKSNYYTVQRAISLDPNTISTSSGDSAESAMLINSLRDVIRKQANELENLQARLKDAERVKAEEVNSLKEQLASLTTELGSTQQKKGEVEKEQEDLLVFLEELSTKRRRDKERLRAASQDVSEDEADGDDGDEE
ncbi:hypothetical protein BD410DRAFT_795388 [Rickenella mellea]|uniref:P115 like vesicle tethering protein n=1 Tax=Rickenella mellea TaxID=50990 RepID=A0A4Y7PPN7_9AGAM|nr:hypothetical protein BD410DRAFT_795388 [Rickenella mellea]